MSYPNTPFIFNAKESGMSPSEALRLTNLEDKYVRTTRFAIISSGTSGSITPPTNSTIILDDFGGTVDAVITTLTGGKPDYQGATGTGGSTVATTFDLLGNYTLSDAPISYPVAIVYRVKQLLVNFDSDSLDIIGAPQIVGDTLRDTFETLDNNLKQYDYSVNYIADNISSVVYSIPSVGIITKTYNYSIGVVSTIVLSGAVPSGTSLTKTFNYSMGKLANVAYS